MLKIVSDRRQDSTQLTVEGRLIGPWVKELEQEWQRARQSGPGSLMVDLTGVTNIAEDGKTLLSRMWQEAAKLVAKGCCTGRIVEEITVSQRNGLSLRSGTK